MLVITILNLSAFSGAHEIQHWAGCIAVGPIQRCCFVASQWPAPGLSCSMRGFELLVFMGLLFALGGFFKVQTYTEAETLKVMGGWF